MLIFPSDFTFTGMQLAEMQILKNSLRWKYNLFWEGLFLSLSITCKIWLLWSSPKAWSVYQSFLNYWDRWKCESSSHPLSQYLFFWNWQWPWRKSILTCQADSVLFVQLFGLFFVRTLAWKKLPIHCQIQKDFKFNLTCNLYPDW